MPTFIKDWEIEPLKKFINNLNDLMADQAMLRCFVFGLALGYIF